MASSSSASEGYAELTAEVRVEDAGVVNREDSGVGKAIFGRRASLLFARPFILVEGGWRQGRKSSRAG